MNIQEIQKQIEKKREASTIDKISIASLLFLSDSLFFELIEELKDKKNLDGNKIIYKIIRLFGGMTLTVPSAQICSIYEYFTHKAEVIKNLSPDCIDIFIKDAREAAHLNSEVTDAYLKDILLKYKKILTREHIVNMFSEQEGSEAAWTKATIKLKKIKSLK